MGRSVPYRAAIHRKLSRETGSIFNLVRAQSINGFL